MDNLLIKSGGGTTGIVRSISDNTIKELRTAQTSLTTAKNKLAAFDTSRFITSVSEPETADNGTIWVQPPLEITATVIKFVHLFNDYYLQADPVADVLQDTTDYDAQVTEEDVTEAKRFLESFVVTISKDTYAINSINLGSVYKADAKPYKYAIVKRTTNWPIYFGSSTICLHKITDPDTEITLDMHVVFSSSALYTTTFVFLGDYTGIVDHVKYNDGDSDYTVQPTATVEWVSDEAPEGISITGYYPLGYFEAANPVVQEISYLTSDGLEVTSLG